MLEDSQTISGHIVNKFAIKLLNVPVILLNEWNVFVKWALFC